MSARADLPALQSGLNRKEAFATRPRRYGTGLRHGFAFGKSQGLPEGKRAEEKIEGKCRPPQQGGVELLMDVKRKRSFHDNSVSSITRPQNARLVVLSKKPLTDMMGIFSSEDESGLSRAGSRPGLQLKMADVNRCPKGRNLDRPKCSPDMPISQDVNLNKLPVSGTVGSRCVAIYRLPCPERAYGSQSDWFLVHIDSIDTGAGIRLSKFHGVGMNECVNYEKAGVNIGYWCKKETYKVASNFKISATSALAKAH
ncbi:hypothetical protein RRG08_008621 [Elysia crispata]|uniref:Uncharacterized protein n=1 Tax=Elysia crispata TaxID=231223 RepID=A0AAE1EBG7_9GAST|nr:hypothetical protein RRG08_008621 [Elysia crispata]